MSNFGGGPGSGDVWNVLSGGGVVEANVISGGQLDLLGGLAEGVLIDSGGAEFISSGGVASGAEVLAGGNEYILSGGLAIGTTIMPGGDQAVGDTGSAQGSDRRQRRRETISALGFASGTHVLGGGQEFVGTQGTDAERRAERRRPGFAQLLVVRGGIASETTVDAGGLLILSTGGVAMSARSGVGGQLRCGPGDLRAGTASGGAVHVQSGGQASGLLAQAPAELLIETGGSATAATISGLAFVSAGGHAINTTVGDGGDVQVAGATEGTLIGSGGEEDILAGGFGDGATIGSGGLQIVFAFGQAFNATILGGGTQLLSRAGFAQNDFVQSGGLVAVAGLSPRLATRPPSPAALSTSAAAHSSTRSAAHGWCQRQRRTDRQWGRGSGVQRRGRSRDHGFHRRPDHGAGRRDRQRGHRQRGGRAADLRRRPRALASVIDRGARITIATHGSARGTLLSGNEADHGDSPGTAVASGGVESVQAQAVASGSVIRVGGQEIVSSGGVALAATLFGGTLSVASGAAISGGLKIHGGKAIVSGTVASGQTVSFTGAAGVLEIDNLAGFHAKISGLSSPNQKLDLGGFAFSAGESVTWTQAGTSGTLKVVNGAKTASLTLIGSYATADFHLATDGHGGTFVSGSPLAASGAGRPLRRGGGWVSRWSGTVRRAPPSMPAGPRCSTPRPTPVAAAASGR